MARNVWSSSDRLEYSRLSRRICNFTTAIYQTRLQPPILHVQVPSHRDTRRWLEAYQHIATLLARNPYESNNLVVTGGSQAGCIGISILYLPPHNITEGEPQIRVEEVLPSDADLTSLAHQDQNDCLCDFSTHTRDVFQALLLASKSSDNLDYNHLLMFILARCRDQLRCRVEAGRHILHSQTSLVDILRSWEPHAEDYIPEAGVLQVVINDNLAALLSEEGVPSTSSPRGEVYFLFSPAIATKWINVLCSILSRFFATVREIDRSTKNLQCLVNQMLMLTALLDSPASRKIFSLTSLQDHLTNFIQQPHGKHRFAEYIQDPPHLAFLFGDEQRAGESVSKQVLRYLHSLLVWHDAALFLVGWLTKLGEQKTPIHIVHFLPPSYASTPMGQSSDRVEHEALAHIFLNFPLTDKEKDILRVAVEELFESTSIELSKELQTLIHVEALAFGFISECHKASWFPLLQDWNGSVGRSCSQGCCYCCNMLFESLLRPQGARLQRRRNADGILMFSLPGLLVPWMPPPLGCGVPLNVLEDLEDEVRSLLISILEEYLKPLIVRILHPSQFEERDEGSTSILLR